MRLSTKYRWLVNLLPLSCKTSVLTRHNHLRNVFVEFCHHAHLRERVESGSSLTPDLSHTWPADVLVLNWERGKHADFDIMVTSPLIPSILTAASLSEGAAAEEAETRKHKISDSKCLELGWVYTAYPNYLYMSNLERSIRKWVLWILFYNIKFKSIYLPKY